MSNDSTPGAPDRYVNHLEALELLGRLSPLLRGSSYDLDPATARIQIENVLRGAQAIGLVKYHRGRGNDDNFDVFAGNTNARVIGQTLVTPLPVDHPERDERIGAEELMGRLEVTIEGLFYTAGNHLPAGGRSYTVGLTMSGDPAERRAEGPPKYIVEVLVRTPTEAEAAVSLPGANETVAEVQDGKELKR